MDIRSENTFNIISLCSGAGGLDLGVGLACRNARVVCHVEIEAYACEVLASHMEAGTVAEAPIWSNLKTFDGKPWRGVVACVVGGFPCQPFSLAGKRAGKDDPRHLWPHIARILEECQPQYCFFENVPGHLSLGFDIVSSELRRLGYEVEAGLFSAEEVGASHLRKRLFILAVKRDSVIALADAYDRRLGQERSLCPGRDAVDSLGWDVADAERPEWRKNDVSRGHPEQRGDEQGQKASRAGELGESLVPREELADANAVRPLDEQQSENGWKTVSVAERSGGIHDQCIELGDTEGLLRTQVERVEQDRILQAMERYGLMPVENGFIPLFPPGPEDVEGWREVLAGEASLEPAVRELADELAVGLVSIGAENRIDQLRLLGNGVVPSSAAYGFCVLSLAHIRKYKSEKA